jgi:hypothetical protein
MAKAKVDRAVNIWTARIIPIVLIGVVGYATYVLVVRLCGMCNLSLRDNLLIEIYSRLPPQWPLTSTRRRNRPPHHLLPPLPPHVHDLLPPPLHRELRSRLRAIRSRSARAREATAQIWSAGR